MTVPQEPRTKRPAPRLPNTEGRIAEGGTRLLDSPPPRTDRSATGPRISIITPVFNGERYLQCCLDGLASQTYTNFEHIVVDGGSKDGTLDILRKQDNHIDYWVSEPDRNMYDALRKGFSVATGEIFAWLNADDLYYPWTLDIVAKLFEAREDVRWLTGIPTTIDEHDRLISIQAPKIYFRTLIAHGYYRGDILGFIQQESTFFRRELYEKTELSTSLRLGGDYELWVRMAKLAKLHTVKTMLASFRSHPAQQSSDIDGYLSECDKICSPRFRFIKYFIIPLSVLLERRILRTI